MGRRLLLFAVAACVYAQPPDPLLARVRARMLDHLSNQPNYTCLETVERTRQVPGGSVQVRDALRLEVALVDGKEMFAWPGAKQFEDKDLRDIVSTGMFGNGNYGLYVRMLFGNPATPFVRIGEVVEKGRRLVRYDFAMRAPESGYYLRVDEVKLLTGFHGSAFVDPDRADLLRLEIIADDIPPQLQLTAAEDRIEYQRVLIGEEEFLLPVESALLMAGKTQISRNHTRFSGCRKFSGESELIFDDPELIENVLMPEAREVAIPADLLLPFEIRSDARLSEAAIGDPVEAVLRSAIKQGKVTLAPKGAVVKGRITFLARTPKFLSVSLTFHEMTWPGGRAAIHANFERRGLSIRPMTSGDAPAADLIFSEPSPRTLKGELLFYRTQP